MSRTLALAAACHIVAAVMLIAVLAIDVSVIVKALPRTMLVYSFCLIAIGMAINGQGVRLRRRARTA